MVALVFVSVVGIWQANPDTLKFQPFLLNGSKGVRKYLILFPVPPLVVNCNRRFYQCQEKDFQPFLLYLFYFWFNTPDTEALNHNIIAKS